MRIGELSRRTGVKPRVIRDYDKRGLISSRRTVHGHRIFDEGDLERLQILLKLRKLDFSLEEIRELLPRFKGSHFQGRAEGVHAALQKKLSQVREKRSALGEVENWLEDVRARLSQDTAGRAHRSSQPRSRTSVPIAVVDACCDPFCGPQTCAPAEKEGASLTPELEAMEVKSHGE